MIWGLLAGIFNSIPYLGPVIVTAGLGVWGAVLAVPMLLMMKAVCDHIEDLQPLGELLGD